MMEISIKQKKCLHSRKLMTFVNTSEINGQRKNNSRDYKIDKLY